METQSKNIINMTMFIIFQDLQFWIILGFQPVGQIFCIFLGRSHSEMHDVAYIQTKKCEQDPKFLYLNIKNASPNPMTDFNDFNIDLENNHPNDAQKAQPQQTLPLPKSYSSQSETGKQEGQFNVGSGDYNLSNAAHPIACIATVGFKILAIFFYLFIGMFAPDVITFIFVIILSSLDFWTVKNVSGRLLVGLRWWTDYNEKGDQVFRFESFDKQFKPNPVDRTFFWTAQLGSSIFWAVFLLIKILSLSPFWALLDAISLGLCGLNLYCYYKCRGDHNKKIKELKNEGLRRFAGKIFM